MVTRARVLLTRPEPGASRTASILRERGFEPVLLPLSAIEPVAPIVPTGPFDLVAVTSANAVRHAPPSLLAALRALPAIAVGARTAGALRAAGFRDVQEGGGTASALADTILQRWDHPARVAYLCGEPRKDTVERRLNARRFSVFVLRTYQTTRLNVDPRSRSELKRAGFDAALVYSEGAAESLCALLERFDLPDRPAARFLCLSPSVAEKLPFPGQILVADEPNEGSLFALLERLF